MLSEDEKSKIVERLDFENQVRTAIRTNTEEAGKKAKYGWLESKLGVLVMGALLSGFLIPLFQYTQETIKWKRQNRYENVKYRLGMMREGVKEFVLVHGFLAEGYERARPFLENPTVNRQDVESYESRKIEMQTRRFLQNAKFASSLIYFLDKDKNVLRRTYNDYLAAVEQYMAYLLRAVQIRLDLLRSHSFAQVEHLRGELQQLKDGIDKLTSNLNEQYDNVLQVMKSQIGASEDETESYM